MKNINKMKKNYFYSKFKIRNYLKNRNKNGYELNDKSDTYYNVTHFKNLL